MPLDTDTVRLIRAYHRKGYRVTEIARHFELARNTVYDIARGKTHPKVVLGDDELRDLSPLVKVRPKQPRDAKPNGDPADNLYDAFADRQLHQ